MPQNTSPLEMHNTIASMLPFLYTPGMISGTYDVFATGEIEEPHTVEHPRRFRLENRRNYFVDGITLPLFVRDSEGMHMPFATAQTLIPYDQGMNGYGGVATKKHSHHRVVLHVDKVINAFNMYSEVDFIRKIQPLLPKYDYNDIGSMINFVETVYRWQMNTSTTTVHDRNTRITYNLTYDKLKYNADIRDAAILLTQFATENLIHGSGLNNQWHITIGTASENLIASFNTSYDWMNENGFYDGGFDLDFTLLHFENEWVLRPISPSVPENEWDEDEEVEDEEGDEAAVDTLTYDVAKDICDSLHEGIVSGLKASKIEFTLTED